MLIVWVNSGGIVIEGSHGEAEWKKFNADKGGGNWVGRAVTYVVSFPRVLKIMR